MKAWLGRAYLRRRFRRDQRAARRVLRYLQELTVEHGYYAEELTVEAFLLVMIGDNDEAFMSLMAANLMNKENPPT